MPPGRAGTTRWSASNPIRRDSMKKYMGRTQAPQWLALPIVALLAACGGGSGDSPGNTNTQTQSLKVSGTVATGAALSGASISVVCASGSDTTKSASDGTYSLSLANGSLPCV